MKKIDNDFLENLQPLTQKAYEDKLIGHYLVEADDLVELSGNINKDTIFYWGCNSHETDTHKAMLIKSSIQPIEKDSFESVLNEMTNTLMGLAQCYPDICETRLINKAKKLLKEVSND